MALRQVFGTEKRILQEQGLVSFLRQIFIYRTYYIYENILDGPQFTPKVDNVSLKILSKPEQFDELVENGFNLSYWDINTFKEKASRGVIVFCVFVKQDLAHITCVALSEEAKNAVDPFPLTMDWQNEACSGQSRTDPNYRRMGLLTYVYSEIFRFLKERGLLRDKFTIEKNNIASNKALAKFGSRVIGDGFCLGFLWWKFFHKKSVKLKVKRNA